METVLDLPTSAAQLPELNKGISRFQYDQHAPTKDITGDAFARGQIHTRFEISGTKRWVPSKSYLRMRCSLTKTGGATQLESSDDVAPNMGLMSNLFQSAEFRIADKTVSRISDYMPQVDALKTRTSKSRAWLESTGQAVNMWEADVKVRREKVSSNGKLIEAGGSVADISTGREALGFGPAGGAARTDNTSVKYDAGDATLTFLAGTADTTIADARTAFPIGSYFQFLALNVAIDAVSNVLMEVIAHTSATVINVRPVVGVDVTNLADGRDDFGRVERPLAGQPSRRVKTFELIWQPPLSIFDVDQALPAGKYELVLNPQIASVYKKRIVESLLDNKVPVTDYEFAVDNMYLYTATLESSRVDDLTYMIDLNEVRCQTEDAKGTNLTQKNFDVSPSTYALTCAFQEDSAGSNTLYSASKLKAQNNEELNLTRLFLSYGGTSRPSIDADPSYIVTSAKDYTTQRYVDTLLQTGQYFQEGGSETIEEWQKRGPYYYFNWPRSGDDRSSRAQVNFQFSALTSSRVLLFDHYRSIATIMVKGSRVVDVRITDA